MRREPQPPPSETGEPITKPEPPPPPPAPRVDQADPCEDLRQMVRDANDAADQWENEAAALRWKLAEAEEKARKWDELQSRAAAYNGTVLCSMAFVEQMAVRDHDGNLLTVERGEPDDLGLYNPTLTRHTDDNLVAQKTTQIKYLAGALLKYGQHQLRCEKSQLAEHDPVRGWRLGNEWFKSYDMVACTCGLSEYLDAALKEFS